jgi:VWFA-related protein
MTMSLALPLLLLAAQQAQAPVFGTRVESVVVDAYVSENGQPLPGLRAESFEVKDDGVVQKVELVAQEDAPLQAILALDVSGSVAGPKLVALKAAAASFLDGLRSQDLPTLLTFSHEMRATSGLPGDPSPVRTALSAAQAGGATALHDALYAALQLADPRHGRPVILVFTDGADSMSWLDAKQVVAAARESDAVVYAVDAETSQKRLGGLSTEVYSQRAASGSLQTNADKMGAPTKISASVNSAHSEFLRALADETGGQVWRTDQGMSLAEGFLRALDQVKTRYVLRYEPLARADGFHKLEVRLRGRKGDVRARRGYVYRSGGA